MMKKLFLSVLLLASTYAISYAQPTLTSVYKQEFKNYNRPHKYEYPAPPVKLGGKYYFVTIDASDPVPQPKKKKKNYVPPVQPDLKFMLNESDGTKTGTRMVAQEDYGIYMLEATTDALLYHNFGPTRGDLFTYQPGIGVKTLSTDYVFNPIYKTTKIYTYPGRKDALISHFENDTYKYILANPSTGARLLYSFPYIEPTRLLYLVMTPYDAPILTDTAFYAVGAQKRTGIKQDQSDGKVFGDEWVKALQGFSTVNNKIFMSLDNDKLMPSARTLFSEPFLLNGKVAILGDKYDNTDQKTKLSIGVNTSLAKINFTDYSKELNRFNFRHILQPPKGPVIAVFKNFIGYITEANGTPQITKLNSMGMNWGRLLFTKDYMFTQSETKVYYQKIYGNEDENNLPFFEKKDIPFSDYIEMIAQGEEYKTTNRYLYYRNKANSFVRFDPASNTTSVVQMPTGTTDMKWQVFFTCDDALIVGGTTIGSDGKLYYEVFMLKD